MKILNFGSANIDFTYRVPHFVRPGETLSAQSITKAAGGKGFNQSVALAKAGCEVYHAGHIGSDGVFLSDLLAEYHVNTKYLTQVDVPTGNALIQVDDNGDNCIILFGGANQTIDEGFIQEVLADFGPGDMIVLQNEINCMNEILSIAHHRGLTIALNPAPMNDNISPQVLGLADWLILNETEASELTGKEEPSEQLAELGKRFPASSFLLTLGVHGSMCQQGNQLYTMGACHVDAVDTTAAGDTFAGFFLASIASENDPQTALLTATRASALAVMKRGAAQSVPSLEQVLTCEFQPSESK